MSQSICSYYDMISKTTRDLDRHVETCRVKLSTERRKISRREAATILKKTFDHDARENVLTIDVQSQHVSFLDNRDQSRFMNKNYTIAFDLSDENVSVLKNSNDDIYDVFDLQFESSIYSVTFAFKVRIYEKETDRKTESCLTFDADHAFSQVHQT
jgi:hypothetical protein